MRPFLVLLVLFVGTMAMAQSTTRCGVGPRQQARPPFVRLHELDNLGLQGLGHRQLDRLEIEMAECILKDSILAWRSPTPGAGDLRAFDEHQRQYCGLVSGHGERLVFINAFCDRDQQRGWKRHWVFVLDGGDCYWQAVINLTSGRVEWYEENGDA